MLGIKGRSQEKYGEKDFENFEELREQNIRLQEREEENI